MVVDVLLSSVDNKCVMQSRVSVCSFCDKHFSFSLPCSYGLDHRIRGHTHTHTHLFHEIQQRTLSQGAAPFYIFMEFLFDFWTQRLKRKGRQAVIDS